MTALDLIRANYRDTGTRNPQPVPDEEIVALQNLEPHSVTSRGILFAQTESYDHGQPLRIHAFKTGPILFVRLSTTEEYQKHQ